MIELVASTLLRHADPRLDFVDRVGGDDFVRLMQRDNWSNRCERIVAEFNAGALALFDADEPARGALEGGDRNGRYTAFPLTSLTIGVVRVAPGERGGAEDIDSGAARAKRRGHLVHLLEA